MDTYLDDDENVKMMRETARTIGLTDLIVRAYHEPTHAHDLLRRALRLLDAFGLLGELS